MKKIQAILILCCILITSVFSCANAETLPEEFRKKFLDGEPFRYAPSEDLQATITGLDDIIKEMEDAIVVAKEVQATYSAEIESRNKVLEAGPKSCNVVLHINFIPNLVFSTYDVTMNIDNSQSFRLPHGYDQDYVLTLSAGEHTFTFHNVEKSRVSGSLVVSIMDDTKIAIKISCNSSSVDVDVTSIGNTSIDASTNVSSTQKPTAAPATKAPEKTTPVPSPSLGEMSPVEAGTMILGESLEEHYNFEHKSVTEESIAFRSEKKEDFLAFDIEYIGFSTNTKSIVSDVCSIALDIAEKIFENPNVNMIRVSCFATMKSTSGEFNNYRVINLFIGRETAQSIDYDAMKKEISTNPLTLIEMVDGQSVHSSFRQGLY